MCILREGFVNLREGFEEAPWRLREAFSKTRSAKASRRRHGRLHLETIRQIMTSPHIRRSVALRIGQEVWKTTPCVYITCAWVDRAHYFLEAFMSP